MMLYGWNLNQWSLAAARHKNSVGALPPSTVEGAKVLQDWWRASYPSIEPGETVILLANPVMQPRETKWAVDTVSLAMQLVHPGVKL